jgi:hypothetical protein
VPGTAHTPAAAASNAVLSLPSAGNLATSSTAGRVTTQRGKKTIGSEHENRLICAAGGLPSDPTIPRGNG